VGQLVRPRRAKRGAQLLARGARLAPSGGMAGPDPRGLARSDGCVLGEGACARTECARGRRAAPAVRGRTAPRPASAERLRAWRTTGPQARTPERSGGRNGRAGGRARSAPEGAAGRRAAPLKRARKPPPRCDHTAPHTAALPVAIADVRGLSAAKGAARYERSSPAPGTASRSCSVLPTAASAWHPRRGEELALTELRRGALHRAEGIPERNCAGLEKRSYPAFRTDPLPDTPPAARFSNSAAAASDIPLCRARDSARSIARVRCSEAASIASPFVLREAAA
jgi:hypothetical protein